MTEAETKSSSSFEQFCRSLTPNRVRELAQKQDQTSHTVSLEISLSVPDLPDTEDATLVPAIHKLIVEYNHGYRPTKITVIQESEIGPTAMVFEANKKLLGWKFPSDSDTSCLTPFIPLLSSSK